MIDVSVQLWSKDFEGLILLNDKIPEVDRNKIVKIIEPEVRPNCFYLMSSGSTETKNDSFKIIELTKEAMLRSASEVNRWVNSDHSDRWLLSLPRFHVGGLSILARCFLSQASYLETTGKWDPQGFVNLISREEITICSLVPTQLHDLVLADLRAPRSLRLAFLGGGRASESLKRKANQLGWPFLETYGMTEVSSQIATAPVSQKGLVNQKLYGLPHIDFKFSNDKRLCLRSVSLMSRLLRINLGKVDEELEFKPSEWYETEDQVQLTSDGSLVVIGRDQRQVKILGELVNIDQIEDYFSRYVSFEESCIVSVNDDRRGKILVLISESDISIELIKAENKRLPGFKRLYGFLKRDVLPRGELGKIKKIELENSISENLKGIRELSDD